MSTRVLFTAEFWLDTFERAIRAAAASVTSLIGIDALTNSVDVDWGAFGMAAGFAAGATIVMSVAASGKVDTVSPASFATKPG